MQIKRPKKNQQCRKEERTEEREKRKMSTSKVADKTQVVSHGYN